MSATLSANMNLPIPGVGTEPGPDYATDVNTSLTLIDMHDHTPGYGVLITPAAMLINTALSFNGQFATSLAGLTLTQQNSTPADSTVYRSGVDLYFTDGNGNNVRLTQSGSVAGATGSISGLTSPASATYVALDQTFVWQSDVSIAANMDAGSILMRNLSPNSTYALTLSPPAGLAANYTLTLPSLPAGATKIMTLTTGGAMSAADISDGITLQQTAAVLSIKNSGVGTNQIADSAVTTAKINDLAVTTGKIAAGAVTDAKLASTNYLLSSSCGAFSTASASFVDVTNLNWSITTHGRPCMVYIISDASGSVPDFSTTGVGDMRILMDGTTTIGNYNAYTAAQGAIVPPPMAVVPSAGSHSFVVQVRDTSGVGIVMNYLRVFFIELK